MYTVFKLDPEVKNQKSKDEWTKAYPNDPLPDKLIEKPIWVIANEDKEVLYTSKTGKTGTWSNAWGKQPLEAEKGMYAGVSHTFERMMNSQEFHRELF